MEPVSLMLATGAAVAAGLTFGLRLDRKRRRRQEEAWRRAAELLGGHFAPRGKSFWRSSPATVAAQVEHGIDVLVDHYTVSTGKSSVTFTRLQAAAPGAGELGLTLREEGTMVAIGKALGLDDIDTGDADFDARFLFRSSDAALARAWLSPPARVALVAMPAGYTAALKRGRVTAQTRGLEMDAEGLVQAVRAVGALAGGGRELLSRWRALAEALGGKLTIGGDVFVPGELSVSCEQEGRLASIETAPPGTRVRVELGRRDAPTFSVAPGQALPAMGRAGTEAWDAVQPATLACDGESVAVSWEGYLPDEARTRAALVLATAAATGGDAPYR